jgi:hypothetical protein
MAGRFARSLELAKASWSVIRADKELLLLPVLSLVALLIVVASVAVPLVALGGAASGANGEPATMGWIGVLVFYVVSYFVGIFFNTALVGAAMIRMNGGNPTVTDGLRIAWERVGRIFAYACIAATIGLALRTLEERVGWLGRLIVKLIGVGWALASFLVVPVLVTRDVGAVDAVKESASLVRKTWGENLIGTLGIGLVFAAGYVALALVAVVLIVVSAQLRLPVLAGLVMVAGAIAALTLAVLQATLQGVYSAALYRYATRNDEPVPGFPPALMRQAFQPK